MRAGEAARARQLTDRTEPKGSRTFADALVDYLWDRKSVFYKRIRQLRKQDRSFDPEHNPLYWLEEQAYNSSEAANYLDSFHSLVLGPMQGADIEEAEVGALLGLRRAATERAELFNPLGEGGKFAADLFEYGKEQIGAKRMEVFEDATQQWWRIRKELVIKPLTESGALSPSFIDQLEENPYYARFTVIQAIEAQEQAGSVGSGVSALKEQIGTLQGIGNPVVETALTDIALQRFAHRNRTANLIVDMYLQNFPSLIKKARRGRGGRLLETRERGWGTLFFMRNGKSQAVYLPKREIQALEQNEIPGPIWMAWNKFAYVPMRQLLVDKNPAFWAYNLIRDSLAFYKNIVHGDPITAGVRTLKYLFKAAPDAAKLVFRHEMTPLVKEGFRSRALLRVGQRTYAAAEESDQAAIDALLEIYSVGSFAEATPVSAKRRLARAAGHLWDLLGRPGEFTERLTKLAGLKYLKENQAELEISDKEIAPQSTRPRRDTGCDASRPGAPGDQLGVSVLERLEGGLAIVG